MSELYPHSSIVIGPIMLPPFKHPDLLTRALTHRSYLNEHPELPSEDNERLEFLGDAILDFIVAQWLYRRFPDLPEGRLTSIRAALVRTEKISEFANQLALGDQLRLGRGEAESGGRARQSLLADAFEAVLGALYLDQGVRAVQHLLNPLLDAEIDRIVAEQTDRDAKSTLQELTQGRFGITPHYRTINERGPDHDKWFTVAVYLKDEAIGQGDGHSKQLAAQAAAANALKKLTQ
jgi:ribonuclease-3